ncbi:MAG TPA: cation diffusion facilitator family transporter [Rhodopila sp.]|uniref:cation diffusion facilitator family transporter n=1 Tax=Rhodopila sp. TaxID=2480087 RepID=UPI002CCF4AC4|nr:cation diffusion facilitator family transporter [Rhodopila sp.]HVY18425.1 cation diffusion facilitator family transporter [Rhodopila sp.]
MHDHSGHAHHHGDDHGGDARRIAWALALTVGFMGAEVVAGFVSGSLTLLADAGHMLTDAAALGMALTAMRVSTRPSDKRRSFGYHRLPVLAALVNGLALFAIVGWIAFEAAQRFLAPVPVLAGPMLIVAVLGLLSNIAAFAILRSGSRDDLNMRGAAAHVVGDLLGSIAAIAAALVILATGWTPIDPLLSVLVALLVLRSAWAVIRRAAHILLEGTPEGFDAGQIRDAVAVAHPDVHDVHHVHVWSLTPERSLATLHVRVRGDASPGPVLRAVTRMLGDRFGLHHATVQIETENCPEGADCAEPSGTPLRPA